MTVARISIAAALATLTAATAALCTWVAYAVSPLGVPVLIAVVAYVAVAWHRPATALSVGFLLMPLELINLPLPSGAVSPAEAAFALVGLCWFVGWITGRAVPAPRARDGTLALIAAITLAGVLVAEDPAPVWRTLVLWTLFAGAFFQAQGLTTAELRRMLIAFGLAGGVLGAIGTVSVIGAGGPHVVQGGLEVGGRATGTLVDPNYFAVLLVLAVVPASAIMLARGRPALWLAPAIAAGIAGIALSFSRGGIVALALALLIVVLATRPRWLFTGVALLALAIIVLHVDVLAGNPELQGVGERVGTLASPSTAETSRRPDIWAVAAEIAQDNPLVGVGVGGFAAASSRLGLTERGTPLENAHNLLFSVSAEQGLIALAALLVLAGQMAGRARRAMRASDPAARALALGLTAALAGFAVQALTIVPTRVQVTAATVMVLAGALTMLSDRAREGVRA